MQTGPETDALLRGFQHLESWQRERWGTHTPDETLAVQPEQIEAVLGDYLTRLEANYPFGHYRYVGQMLKPPHPLAQVAYALAMTINPNNHALDGSPATSAMEKVVVAELAAMFGFPEAHLGHLTSGGTVANLEALWVARQLHPECVIVGSQQAHYTHSRMCAVLGARYESIAVDAAGRMDVAALEARLLAGDVGTIVATLGTTSMGAVDPLHEILPLARKHGARVHVDSAYGGFYTLLAQAADPQIDPRAYLAIAEADSVVVDPHKHGLQPYGCGSVLFRDPAVGRFYLHDSPYTYFTSDELHLGEISLECSRAGAAAGALWATLRALPLASDSGLGPILTKSRHAALRWAELINAEADLHLLTAPDLDIVCLFPAEASERISASAISTWSQAIFDTLMNDPDDPWYLATLRVGPEQLAGHPADGLIDWDTDSLLVLRSVLMKPEHLAIIPDLHAAVLRAMHQTHPSVDAAIEEGVLS